MDLRVEILLSYLELAQRARTHARDWLAGTVLGQYNSSLRATRFLMAMNETRREYASGT